MDKHDELTRLIGEWDAEAANLERAGVGAPFYDKGKASGFRQCAENLRTALAQSAKTGGVTDEMVERAYQASINGWHQNSRTQMRAALTAALSTPQPKDAT